MDYLKLANRAAILTGSLLQIPKELLPFMEYLDKEVKPKSFLEIGMSLGATYYIWCSLVEPGGIKMGIDLPNGPYGAGTFRNEQQLEITKHAFQTVAPNSHVLFSDSKFSSSVTWVEEKLKKEDSLLDFLFIDGDHTYEGVRADYYNYSPFVKKGGVVVFHDIKNTDKHRELNCTVYKFWEQLKGNKREFIDNSYGWGGIGVLIQSK